MNKENVSITFRKMLRLNTLHGVVLSLLLQFIAFVFLIISRPSQSLTIWVASVGAISACTTVYLIYHSLRQMRLKLLEVQSTLFMITQDKLKHQLSAAEHDRLQHSVQTITRMLEKIIARIHTACKTLYQSTTEIATGNDELRQRTRQQGLLLAETSQRVNDLENIIMLICEQFKDTVDVSDKARMAAEEGGRIARNAVAAMKTICEQSEKIKNIIQVVNDIAFQTNILSINASVESARAGELGRGFAVVAAEIRSLSGRTAEAAGQIKDLIKASIESVNEGSNLVSESGIALEEIVTANTAVSDKIKNMSEATLQQTNDIREITKAIDSLSAFTEMNTSLVEEVSASSEATNNEIGKIQETVKFFNVETNIMQSASRKEDAWT